VTLYVEASALLKLYLDEPESSLAEEILRGDGSWVSACFCAVEVRRNLARALSGDALADARAEFADDWAGTLSVEIDSAASDRAAELAEATGVRTLDALHLEAAERSGAAEELLPVVTFDRRLAGAARSLGWAVLP
jgi:hypothetical protein